MVCHLPTFPHSHEYFWVLRLKALQKQTAVKNPIAFLLMLGFNKGSLAQDFPFWGYAELLPFSIEVCLYIFRYIWKETCSVNSMFWLEVPWTPLTYSFFTSKYDTSWTEGCVPPWAVYVYALLPLSWVQVLSFGYYSFSGEGKKIIIQNAHEELNSFCKITWGELDTSAPLVQSLQIVLNALRRETFNIQLPQAGRGRHSCMFSSRHSRSPQIWAVTFCGTALQQCSAVLSSCSFIADLRQEQAELG